jgi:hypothetical protein
VARYQWEAIFTLEDVQVSPADAARRDANYDVSWAGNRIWSIDRNDDVGRGELDRSHRYSPISVIE